jgi:pyruvate ferredoxin oxidoreductase alpha subunit
MREVLAMTGNGAAAQAMRQINPDVCAAYPITPSTQVMEDFSQFVADGLVDTELITVESEHSAQSACVGAAAAGGRVMNATSANGLALMWEILYIASGSRLPMVLTVVNRALSSPINIHADHGDQMGCRDAGWIQFYSENSQEQYDNLIQAIPISEEMNVRLPVMVGMDGFIISHSIERVEMLEDAEVQHFIGEYKPHYPLLDIHNPVTYGPVAFHDYYFECKRQQIEAMNCAKDVILDIGKKYGKLSGREYGFFVPYKLEDAEIAIVAIGSACGTTRVMVDQLRQKGIKAGLLKIRCFRPFPAKEIADALSSVNVVAVLDRSDTFGGLGGPLFSEIRSAMYDYATRPQILNFVYGLGGRELDLALIEKAFAKARKVSEGGASEPVVEYLGVRE